MLAALDERLLRSGSIQIFDADASGKREEIFNSSIDEPLGSPTDVVLTVFDQSWILRFTPPVHGVLYPFTLVVLIGGISFSLLLLAYVLLVQRRNEDLYAMIGAQAEREAERAAFVRELNHRVKNILSSISSIFQMTRRRAVSLDEFADDFAGRLAALANVHSAVFQANGDAAQFSHIVELTFSPYRAKGADRISFKGPEILLSAEAATTLALCFHELATNALKYGALLRPEDRQCRNPKGADMEHATSARRYTTSLARRPPSCSIHRGYAVLKSVPLRACHRRTFDILEAF